MRLRTVWMAMAALLGLAPAAAAQATTTPEETARAFLAALDGRRWDEAAALIAPATARRDRDLAVSLALAQLEQTRKSSGGGNFVISTSGTPDAADLRRFASHPLRSLRGVSTLGEAAALEPRDFMARMMESSMMGPPGAIAKPAPHRYLGIVVESDSVAHALFRNEVRSFRDDDDEPQVLQLRRADGRWYVIPGALMFMRGSALLDWGPDR